MIVKLLTEQHLEFLSLKGGCTGWSESTLLKMPHCWKSHVTAQILFGRQNLPLPEKLGLREYCISPSHDASPPQADQRNVLNYPPNLTVISAKINTNFRIYSLFGGHFL